MIVSSLLSQNTAALLKSGAGSPEGVTTANVGALYLDTTNGKLYDKRTGTGNTGWVLIDRCESGTWTPTGTGVANIDSVTPSVSVYSRVGDTVSFVCVGTFDPTLTSTVTQFRLTLPVASNFAATSDLSAVGATGGYLAAFATADAANDQMWVSIFSNGTTSQSYYLSGSYRVI